MPCSTGYKFLLGAVQLLSGSDKRGYCSMTFAIAPAAFYYMAGVSVASALLAVTRKNPVHSMLWVLVLFIHTAGIFLVLGAEFLAAVQVIVYAGAILIFYLFIVMLLDLAGEETQPRFGKHWLLAVGVGLVFMILSMFVQVDPSRPVSGSAITEQLASAGSAAAKESETGAFRGGLAEVGHQLFGPFVLPFEILSLLLLAAIIGAVVLTRRRTDES